MLLLRSTSLDEVLDATRNRIWGGALGPDVIPIEILQIAGLQGLVYCMALLNLVFALVGLRWLGQAVGFSVFPWRALHLPPGSEGHCDQSPDVHGVEANSSPPYLGM